MYFSGMVEDLRGSEEALDFLNYTRITKKAAENIYSASKIEHENGKVIDVIEIEEGEYLDSIFWDKDSAIKIGNIPLQNRLNLRFNSSGIHQLGGRIPSDLIMPNNVAQSPMCYLGFFSNVDSNLSWLPIKKLNLFCPLYSDFEIMYVSYENPIEPIILNREEIGKDYNSLSETYADDFRICFDTKKMKLEECDLEHIESDYMVGHIGAPEWVQQNIIPKCPISKKKMKFLVQFDSDNGIPFLEASSKINEEELTERSSHLTFWEDGVLFVFIEPETKVVAYYIQNT